MLFKHSMSITQQMPTYNTTVHKTMSNVALLMCLKFLVLYYMTQERACKRKKTVYRNDITDKRIVLTERMLTVEKKGNLLERDKR